MGSVKDRIIKINTNTKLGRTIGSFNLPALVTCPGASAFCKKICYARKGNFCFSVVKASHARAFEASKREDFIARAIAECSHCNMIRLHSSGDFPSISYTRKWYRIVEACPNTQFCAYTRSWVRPGIRIELLKLSSLPNMHLFASVDDSMSGIPDSSFRKAYCHPEWRRPKDSFRCPHQVSVKKPTCTECRLCYRPPGRFNDVEFLVH